MNDFRVDSGERHEIREPNRRFTLVPFDQISMTSVGDDLIKGLLPRQGLAVLWGQPKGGKSFITLDIALHVALGWKYQGFCVQQGAVVYIAGEGQHGFSKRIEAFRREQIEPFRQREGGKMEPPPFYLIGEPLDFIGQHRALISDIRAELGEESPSLIVLDTLNRTLRGSENDPEDMGRYVAAADALRAEFSCCVLVVHHCGNDRNRPRGHTSLTGAADVQIAVTKSSNGLVTMTVELVKEGPEGLTLAFQLRPVEVGRDDDGDPITSCVVEQAQPNTVSGRDGPNLSRSQKTMLSILHAAMPHGLTVDEWNERARDAGLGKGRKADLYDFRVALRNKGLVHEFERRWHIRQP